MILPPNDVDQLRAVWRAAYLEADREDPGPGWRMEAGGGPLTRLYVSGMIGGYRMDAGTFVQAVHALQVDTIHLHVNSPGGFVWDAVSMYEALRSHPATVISHIDGVAASAASLVALAGDQVEIARAGRVMIHDAETVAYGSPAQVRRAAELVDAISDDMAALYAERAGGKPATWRAAMSATTWYSSAQAVASGLAHRVAGETTDSGPDNRTRLIQARQRALTTQGG